MLVYVALSEHVHIVLEEHAVQHRRDLVHRLR